MKLRSFCEKYRGRRCYEYLLDALFCTAGSLLYAVSVSYFTAPSKIAPGGVTGIATILYYTIHTPIGMMSLLLNIPLFILGMRLIGGSFMAKSLICTVLSSVFVDLTSAWMKLAHLPPYGGEKILAALFGGVLAGIGLALVFLRGATTGGTDIASRLLKLRYRHVSMGRMMLIIDAGIITASAIVFGDVNSALYAIICIFASSLLIDRILYGSETGRMAIIISKHNEKIANAIISDLDRGLTILRGRGYYSGKERDVILCAVRRPESARLRSIVRDCDPAAFIIMCEADEVIGEGFRPITKEI